MPRNDGISMQNKTACFILPCYIHIGSKKISLNLNWYRNAHYMILAKAKETFYPIKWESFKAKKISVKYTLVLSDNKRTDVMNWITIVDKFFMDWLVNNGYMKDDSSKECAAIQIESAVNKAAVEKYITAEVTILE